MGYFLTDPARKLRTYLTVREMEPDPASYDWGMLALALEIVTAIKTLETIPVATEYGRQEAISALTSILASQGLSDKAFEAHYTLWEWQRTKFLSDARQPGLALSGSDGASPQQLSVLPEFDAEDAFAPLALESSASPQHAPDEQPVGHRNQDAPPSDVQTARP